MALWTQDDIDTLRAAIASGILSVHFNGPPARSITYHSLDAMRSLLAEMVAEVSPTRRRWRRVRWNRGFDRGE